LDKVLFIDGLNFIYRASIRFGFKESVHELCFDCDKYVVQHQLGNPHCKCGGTWSMLEDKCEFETNPDHIIIFNFFRNLRPIIELFKPDKCFFVLEGHPQFRYDLYADYKANRIIKTASKQETRDQIFRCKDEIVRLLRYLPITSCLASAYEADDVISTLVDNMSSEDLTIVSSDSDYIQLLQKGYKNFEIYNSIKKEFMVAPKYFYVAWKCLAGDKSDNIKALLKPKKVEAAMNDLKEFSKFMALEENRANFSINKKLIEFANVPLEEIIFTEGSSRLDLLKQEFEKMKFASITNDNSWNKFKSTFDCIKY
jgi:5'-3' exonuclease